MKRMTAETFKALIDLRGSDLSRWPSADAAEAAALVEVDAVARAMLDGAGRLDQAWSDTRPPAADRTLHARIMQSLPPRSAAPAHAPARWSTLLGELGGWRVAGPAFATALALGIALGYGMNDETAFDLVDLAGFSDIEIEY